MESGAKHAIEIECGEGCAFGRLAATETLEPIDTKWYGYFANIWIDPAKV